jgi:hypothetical protein
MKIAPARGRTVQKRRVAGPELSEAKRNAFFQTLAATCNVALASKVVGVDPAGIYRARRRDPAFAAGWDEALAIGYDRLEAEALRYAIERIGDVPIDPESADAAGAVAGRGAVAALTERRASDTDLRFVLSILGRYRAAADGRRQVARVGVATQAETDARLTELLDRVTRRMRTQKALAAPAAEEGGGA